MRSRKKNGARKKSAKEIVHKNHPLKKNCA